MARFLAGLVVLAFLALGAVITWPQYLELERTLPFAQLIASRVALALLGIAFIVLLGLVALIARPMRSFVGGLCIVLVLVAAANVGISWVRGVGDLGGADSTAAAAEGEVTVLAWNTGGDAVTPETVAVLAIQRQAAVLVLSETSATHAVAVTQVISTGGGPDYAVHTADLDPSGADPTRSTTVLVRTDLGAYELRDGDVTGNVVPTLTLRSADGTGPTIVGVHLAPPMPASMDEWRAGIALVQTRCGDANTLLAGDFNATLDHLGDLGRCSDAALAHGAGAAGTWPAQLPAVLGAGLDRVIAGGNWRAQSFAVLSGFDQAGSDHRPVVSVLAPR